jgi:hypothetical protein
MRVKNENLLDDSGAVDLSVDADLKPVWLGHIANYAIQLVFTGSPQGNFKLQASNDDGRINAASEENQVSSIQNWTDITDSAQSISAAGDHMWTVENAGYNWVRVVWTATGGSGSLSSARAYVKGI